MASYKLIFKDSIQKDLRKLPQPLILKTLEACQALTLNPFPLQCRKLADAEKSYRIRVGNHRIIYQIDSTARTVLILHIRHRKDIYKKC